jgi:hypothetical protein
LSSFSNKDRRGVWVPACAGTTVRVYCAGVAAAAAAGSGAAFVSCVTTRSPAFAATDVLLLSNRTR